MPGYESGKFEDGSLLRPVGEPTSMVEVFEPYFENEDRSSGEEKPIRQESKLPDAA